MPRFFNLVRLAGGHITDLSFMRFYQHFSMNVRHLLERISHPIEPAYRHALAYIPAIIEQSSSSTPTPHMQSALQKAARHHELPHLIYAAKKLMENKKQEQQENVMQVIRTAATTNPAIHQELEKWGTPAFIMPESIKTCLQIHHAWEVLGLNATGRQVTSEFIRRSTHPVSAFFFAARIPPTVAPTLADAHVASAIEELINNIPPHVLLENRPDTSTESVNLSRRPR